MLHYTEYKKPKYNLEKKNIKRPFCQDIFVLDVETSTVFRNKNDLYTSHFDYCKDASFYNELHKVSYVYIWQFSINDVVYYGRYLEEFREFIKTVENDLKGRYAVIYVHNLAYEFQFLRNILIFDKIFAREKRKPMNCTLKDSKFIFKCSLMLSGLKLEKIPEQYNMKINKKIGQLDYLKIRHPETPLTDLEMEYCESDCLIVYEYIKLMIKEYMKIQYIPLTSTAKIRLMFQEFLKENDNPMYALKNWKSAIAKHGQDTETFLQLVKCFSGGYTHSNLTKTNEVIYDLKSFDFISSYPAVMLSEKFPCGTFRLIKLDNLERINTKDNAYIITIKLKNIISTCAMSYISAHKCGRNFSNMMEENGRIFQADEIQLTITEQDWLIIKENYIFDYELVEVKTCKKYYLPKVFLKFIAKIYKTKNDIKEKLNVLKDQGKKNTEEFEQLMVAYNLAKANLNSLYGMCVTNYITDEILWENDEWNQLILSKQDITDKLEELRFKEKLLLPYQWGVWITAYARRNLWFGITKIDDDVCYTDTDSIKYIGDHDDLIEEYNKIIDKKIVDMCVFSSIPFGDVLGIGRFDPDGEYSEFKTLGAKKYSYRTKEDSVLHITVSGVDPKIGVEAMKNDINNFRPNFLFDYNFSGKNQKFYNDNQPDFIVKDYLNNELELSYKYGIALYPTTYLLGITGQYNELIELSNCGSIFLNNL